MTETPTAFPTWGYHLVSLNVSDDDLEKLRLEAQHLKTWTKVFKTLAGGTVLDEYRLQSSVLKPTKLKSRVIRNFQEVAKCFDPEWVIKDLRFLWSKAGGEDQVPHHDITATAMAALPEGKTFASFLIALQPNTKLIIYPGCTSTIDEDKRFVLNIPVGFCLIFRGDLVHAGHGYKEENIRAHGILTFKGSNPDTDQVEYLHDKWICEYCAMELPSSSKLASHKFWCKSNPAHEEHRHTKNKRRRAGGNCEFCSKNFGHYESLRRHQKQCSA
jgi:hypothetical protein